MEEGMSILLKIKMMRTLKPDLEGETLEQITELIKPGWRDAFVKLIAIDVSV